MSRYYGFSVGEIGDMSVYQFSSYLDDITEIEELFSGGKTTQKKSVSTEELINRARQKGLKVPKYY